MVSTSWRKHTPGIFENFDNYKINFIVYPEYGEYSRVIQFEIYIIIRNDI